MKCIKNNKIKNYFENNFKLDLALFASGAWLMIFELLWSRIIWPFFWTSHIVWTSIIWIILLSMSLGYYLWGKIADKNSSLKLLSSFFIIISWFLLVIYLFKNALLNSLQLIFSNIFINTIFASLILFWPISMFFGFISPYIAKIKINSLKSSWKELWNIYAISTIWSIFGTFFAWFFLIPFFWTNNIILWLALIFLIFSFIFDYKKFIKSKLFLLILIFVLFIFQKQVSLINQSFGLYNYDTNYSNVTVKNISIDWENIKLMKISNENSSAKYLDNDENLVFAYTKYYDLASYFNPDFTDSLMLWWAWYVYPSYYLKKYPQKKIDVVEIDPMVTEIAKKHFDLKKNKNLKIIHEDWRTFLNKNTKKYDVIFWDAFKSQFSLPFNLTTVESYKKMYDSLNDDWLVIVNIISAFTWPRWDFFRAEYRTIREVFPYVLVFKPSFQTENNTQNIVLVVGKKVLDLEKTSEDSYINELLLSVYKKQIPFDKPILTDDYAPVDYYSLKAIN